MFKNSQPDFNLQIFTHQLLQSENPIRKTAIFHNTKFIFE